MTIHRPTLSRCLTVSLWLAAAALSIPSSPALAESGSPTSQPAATQPAEEASSDTGPPKFDLPYLRIDREARTVDILATVVTREADWLELLACTEGTREYEAILAIHAKPSHIHLALLMLNYQPGHPIGFEWEGEVVKAIPPQGDRVTVSLLVPRDPQPADGNGQAKDPDQGDSQADPADEGATEAPAPSFPAAETLKPISPGRWIRNQVTGAPLPDATWLFTGSRFREIPAEGDREARRVYEADLSGSAISLVNFGDDLLTRPTLTTNKTDDGAWQAVPDAMPPRGATVVIRLSPAPEKP